MFRVWLRGCVDGSTKIQRKPRQPRSLIHPIPLHPFTHSPLIIPPFSPRSLALLLPSSAFIQRPSFPPSVTNCLHLHILNPRTLAPSHILISHHPIITVFPLATTHSAFSSPLICIKKGTSLHQKKKCVSLSWVPSNENMHYTTATAKATMVPGTSVLLAQYWYSLYMHLHSQCILHTHSHTVPCPVFSFSFFVSPQHKHSHAIVNRATIHPKVNICCFARLGNCVCSCSPPTDTMGQPLILIPRTLKQPFSPCSLHVLFIQAVVACFALCRPKSVHLQFLPFVSLCIGVESGNRSRSASFYFC